MVVCLLVAASLAPTAGTHAALGATPTETQGDLEILGVVYHAYFGPTAGVPGATVSLCTSVPRCFPATTGPDGAYSLDVPATYAQLVNAVRVWADGYVAIEHSVSPGALRAQPQRDFALHPLPRIYLPLVLR